MCQNEKNESMTSLTYAIGSTLSSNRNEKNCHIPHRKGNSGQGKTPHLISPFTSLRAGATCTGVLLLIVICIILKFSVAGIMIQTRGGRGWSCRTCFASEGVAYFSDIMWGGTSETFFYLATNAVSGRESHFHVLSLGCETSALLSLRPTASSLNLNLRMTDRCKHLPSILTHVP